MNFKVELDLKEFKAGLSEMAKSKIPFAVAGAMNSTVFSSRTVEQQAMERVFHRGVTPYLTRAVRYSSAAPGRLEASLYVSEESNRMGTLSPSEVLAPQIFGGSRGRKRSERRLLSWAGGTAMRSGQYMVPGSGAPRDAYGNISGPQMQRILGYARAFREAGYNKTKKTAGHYVVPGKGVFKRVGNISVPVLIFTNRVPQYKKLFPFHKEFASYVSGNFLKHLAERWGSAMLKAGYRGY